MLMINLIQNKWMKLMKRIVELNYGLCIMSIKNNKVREALKLIPSIDEILKKQKNSSDNVPQEYLKFNLNKTLNDIRTNFLDEKYLEKPENLYPNQ